MTAGNASSNLAEDITSQLEAFIKTRASEDRNEAETRHKIIDFVVHEILAWPRNRVEVEKAIHPGFADYTLTKSTGKPLLYIEAKREGAYFEVPLAHKPNEFSTFIGISKLLSDDNVKAAMQQVRNYCFDTGCEYACITNGHEWIFFKTFEKDKRWDSMQAFVVRSLEFFDKEHTKAINNFSFTAVSEKHSLVSLLTSAPPRDRSIYYPKEKIAAYSHSITANKLAPALRPLVSRYFGVIKDDDPDFMAKCYVSQRDYQGTYDGMRAVIQDSLTPYFADFGVQQLEDTGKGGHLGGKLTKNIKHGRKGEVLVLFGGKGSGKSTFIKRLLHHNTPHWLRDHAVICITDLLKTPENADVIREEIWTGLVNGLDRDNLLNQPRENLLSTLFADRFEVAKKQDLAGLPISSENYSLQLNALVAHWKSDKIYCAKRLVEYWRRKNKGIIVVVDNTDQYGTEVQDFCFSSAQEVSKLLECVVLISMREERFYDSKIHGVLDAFQNAGFHISSPKPAEVFKRRLDYAISLLKKSSRRGELIREGDEKVAKDCETYLTILSREFSDDTSPLNSFLSACAHGDIRLSLDLFRSFVQSGYTNVEEMLELGRWKFQIHQVIKPVMIPNRYFYDESLSDIPNIFQLRSLRHSSHFTALRILRKLTKSVDISSATYFSVAELRAYFAETFNMLEDFEANVDMLLKRGFVEANNRLDFYSANVDSIKVTTYGLYMINELAFYFTYLDLVCTDCGIFDLRTSNHLTEAAKNEYALFVKGDRMGRIAVRLDRVDQFITYLAAEESREREMYSLGMPLTDMFTHRARTSFETEKLRVSESAKKQKRTPRAPRKRP